MLDGVQNVFKKKMAIPHATKLLNFMGLGQTLHIWMRVFQGLHL